MGDYYKGSGVHLDNSNSYHLESSEFRQAYALNVFAEGSLIWCTFQENNHELPGVMSIYFHFIL